MDVREKLVELLRVDCCPDNGCDFCNYADFDGCRPHFLADHLIANGVTLQENAEISDELFKRLKDAPITVGKEESSIEPVQEWVSVDERLPKNFVSVLGYMTDAGEFPPVRECYTVGNAFFFPALGDVHPVSHWCEMPQPPKGE